MKGGARQLLSASWSSIYINCYEGLVFHKSPDEICDRRDPGVLVTNRTDLKGQFLAPDSLCLLWNSASLKPENYYFIVEGCGLVDGCIGPSVRLVSSVQEVDCLCRGDAVDFLSVNKVHLLAPPSMTKQSEFSMQLLSEIRIQKGSQPNPVYEFVTRDGQVYSSARG